MAIAKYSDILTFLNNVGYEVLPMLNGGRLGFLVRIFPGRTDSLFAEFSRVGGPGLFELYKLPELGFFITRQYVWPENEEILF